MESKNERDLYNIIPQNWDELFSSIEDTIKEALLYGWLGSLIGGVLCLLLIPVAVGFGILKWFRRMFV